MPWKHKPGRSDIACLAWLGGLGVFSMLMLPLRAWLMGSPDRIPLLVALTGSRTGTAMLGAVVRTGDYAVSWDLGGHLIAISWVWPMIAAVIMSCKFDWIYWWAGKLWGKGIINIIVGDRGERAQRNADRAANLTHKYSTLAIALTYVPFLPFPTPVVHAALGMAGTSLTRFLALDLFFALISRAGYMYLGYRIGEPAVGFLEVYGQYAWYVSIGLIVVIFAGMWWRSRRKRAQEA